MNNRKITWRKLIKEAAANNDDSFDSLVITIDEGELDREFDDGSGGTEGSPFTAWSNDYVYFPVCYGGAEWVDSVPRHPGCVASSHKGR